MKLPLILKKYLDCPISYRNTHGIEKKEFRIIFETEDILINYSEMDLAEELPESFHKIHEIVFRLQGKTIHNIDGKEYLVEENMVLDIPPFTKHSCKVMGSEKVQQITVLVKNQIYSDFFRNE